MEAAHVDYAGTKGVSLKVHDRYAVPMCSEHHRCQHSWGWETFEANFKVNALESSNAYWAAWPGRGKWEAERA